MVKCNLHIPGMKKTLFLLTFFLCCHLAAQKSISNADWRADLRFLQKTVHEDYPFLFKKTTPEVFDTAVEELHAKIPELQDHEVLVGLAKIVSLFKYGHTGVGFRDNPIAYHKVPMVVYQFTDGVYITGAHKEYKDIVGAKIVKVEDRPINEVLKAIYPVVPAENDQYFKAYGINHLTIPEVLHAQGISKALRKKMKLHLEKDGKAFVSTIDATDNLDFPLQYGEVKPDSDWVSARDLSNPPHHLKNLDKIYYYEYLPEEKAVYVRHSQIQDDPTEDIPSFFERVFDFIENNDVDKLVLDVRLNGGGNNYKNIPVVTGIIETKKINKTGKLYVIIGRRTFSACQNLVNELDNYTNVIFVGEPTAENINFYGDNRKVVLPNSGVPVYLSFAWWQDKPQWENGPYTVPDVTVEPSFDDYRSNRDPVLEKTLDFDGANFISDPMAYLRELFEANKIDLLKKEAMRLVNDPLYQNIDFESEFNRAGYSLLDADRQQEAIFVFELTTALFPESDYSWYSLAEAYLKAGDTTKAKKFYQKAIDLNPKGSTANFAKSRLEKIAGD